MSISLTKENNIRIMQELSIIYEDNHIIALNKKPSQIVQGDKTGDIPLSELLKGYLKKKYNKPGNVFVGVVHRLDRPASGVVLFAKTSKALTRLNTLFRDNKISKYYWALVKNRPPQDSDTLVHYLIKNQASNKSVAFDNMKENAKEAILKYNIISSTKSYFLLEINLLTGRHHQIRCQLSKIGCPIKGDVKYGFDRPNKDLSIHLHARKIEFIHPISIELTRIVADPPSDPIWDTLI